MTFSVSTYGVIYYWVVNVLVYNMDDMIKIARTPSATMNQPYIHNTEIQYMPHIIYIHTEIHTL